MSEDQESDAIIYTRVTTTTTRNDVTYTLNSASRPGCNYITTIATVLPNGAQAYALNNLDSTPLSAVPLKHGTTNALLNWIKDKVGSMTRYHKMMLFTLFVILLLLAGTSVAVACNFTRSATGPQDYTTTTPAAVIKTKAVRESRIASTTTTIAHTPHSSIFVPPNFNNDSSLDVDLHSINDTLEYTKLAPPPGCVVS